VLPVALNLLAEAAGDQKLTLADLGCGNGYAAAKFNELGHRTTGVDISPEGIDTARAAYRSIRFELGSLYDNELASRLGTVFDCVVALEVIEHLQYPKMLFKRAFELLRPGGFLILSTPYYGYLKNLAIAIVDAWNITMSHTTSATSSSFQIARWE
jgi:2-polyprenyl-6-hydroxyphenyl methylase/3-demethylubiquinone-9 3-methyltransferase